MAALTTKKREAKYDSQRGSLITTMKAEATQNDESNRLPLLNQSYQGQSRD